MLPTTSSVLLEALGDPGGDAAWSEFDARYRPVLLAFARRLELDDDDAREVAQDALAAFVTELRAGHYDPGRGRLRSWLFTMVRARVARLKRDRARDRREGGAAVLEGLQDEHTLSAIWEEQWRHAILLEALRHLREDMGMQPRTVRVFEAIALENRPVAEVAAEEGMTPNAVHQAKFRALERMREILAHMDQTW